MLHVTLRQPNPLPGRSQKWPEQITFCIRGPVDQDILHEVLTADGYGVREVAAAWSGDHATTVTGKTIVDIGAHIGAFARLAHGRGNSRARRTPPGTSSGHETNLQNKRLGSSHFGKWLRNLSFLEQNPHTTGRSLSFLSFLIRGKRNEPAYVAHTAMCLAAVGQLQPEVLAQHATRNARMLFGF